MIKSFFIKCPFIFSLLNLVFCSIGDNSPFYRSCVKNCRIEVCDADPTAANSSFLGFPLWSCTENCDYDCQWKTVEVFQRKNWPIPQFRGKWPFIRFFGFQEPASVIFSVMNLIVNLKLIIHFRENVPNSTAFYYLWSIFSYLQINSWIWSIVYHTRDTDLTERLDYMSAFSVVVYSLYGAGVRFMNNFFNIKFFLWSIFCIVLGVNHLAYLWFYDFDYSYNMTLNCIVGGASFLLWIFWSFLHFEKQRYVWKIICFVVLMCASILLEVLDFPPLFWVFDAHSLWHGSTIIINIVLYSFLVDDCNHLVYFNEEKLLSLHKKH